METDDSQQLHLTSYHKKIWQIIAATTAILNLFVLSVESCLYSEETKSILRA